MPFACFCVSGPAREQSGEKLRAQARSHKGLWQMTKIETFNSVWDALADTPEQAANLRARAELMRQIADVIETNGWKQSEAAAHCGVTQPRINDLLRGRVSRFSLDALVNIATAIGRRVHVALEVA